MNWKVVDQLSFVVPMLHIWRHSLTAIPDEISKLQNLKELNLGYTAITSEWNPLYVAPILHFLHISWFSGLPDTIGNLKNLQNLNLYGCKKLEGNRHQLSFVLSILHWLK